MIYEPLGDFGVLSPQELEKLHQQQEEFRKMNGFVELPEVKNYVPLEEKFKNINSIDDVVLGGYIKDYWVTIINDMYSGENIINRVHIFRNVRFIDGLRKYLAALPKQEFDFGMVTKIDYLIYHFRDDESSELNKALEQLAILINREYISRISRTVNIDEATANELVVARFSSIDNKLEAAKNLNSIIMKTSMTKDNIIDVYHALYDHLSDIYIGVMFDVRENMTPHEEEMYQNITTAILDYLNMQEIGVIMTVLSNDIQLNYFYYAGMKRRFSIREIPADAYGRIIYAASELQHGQGMYVL